MMSGCTEFWIIFEVIIKIIKTVQQNLAYLILALFGLIELISLAPCIGFAGFG